MSNGRLIFPTHTSARVNGCCLFRRDDIDARSRCGGQTSPLNNISTFSVMFMSCGCPNHGNTERRDAQDKATRAAIFRAMHHPVMKGRSLCPKASGLRSCASSPDDCLCDAGASAYRHRLSSGRPASSTPFHFLLFCSLYKLYLTPVLNLTPSHPLIIIVTSPYFGSRTRC